MKNVNKLIVGLLLITFQAFGQGQALKYVFQDTDGNLITSSGGSNIYVKTLGEPVSYSFGLTEVESVRPWRCIACSSNMQTIVAGGLGTKLYLSTDGGINWTDVGPSYGGFWTGIASSADGTNLVAVQLGGFPGVWTSTDGGTTWSNRTSYGNYMDVASSADGTKLITSITGNTIYTSTDAGTNWTSRLGGANWNGVASSADGTKLVAVPQGGQMQTSVDGGTNWTARDNGNWMKVAMSADGTKLAATVSSGYIYVSTNSGVTWTNRGVSALWNKIAMSADGTRMIAASSTALYTSTDTGLTWIRRAPTNVNWNGVASSYNGTNVCASVYNGMLSIGGYVYPVSTPYLSAGTSFTANVITASSLVLTNLPTVTNGLPVGALYQSGSNVFIVQ